MLMASTSTGSRGRSGRVQSLYTMFGRLQSSRGALQSLGKCQTLRGTTSRLCTRGSCLFGTTLSASILRESLEATKHKEHGSISSCIEA